jgi:hypothetical protein
MDDKKEKKAEAKTEAKPKTKAKPKAKPKKLEVVKIWYQERLWRGVKTVFQCVECLHCENDRDDIILHVLNHVPEKDRNSVFDRLMR